MQEGVKSDHNPILTLEEKPLQTSILLSETEDDEIAIRSALKQIQIVGKLKIKRQLSGPVLAQRQAATVRMLNVTEYVEVYAYTTLLVIFAYIIAMAVIGMAYGRDSSKES